MSDEDRARLARADSAALAKDEDLPVVARLVIEVRSDGTRTVARGAAEDALSGEKVAIEVRGGSPLQLALSMMRSMASLPALAKTFRAMLLDVDLSLVYRFGETFFMRAGPEVGVTLGGRRTVESKDASAGAGRSVLQVSGVVGFGMNLEL